MHSHKHTHEDTHTHTHVTHTHTLANDTKSATKSKTKISKNTNINTSTTKALRLLAFECDLANSEEREARLCLAVESCGKSASSSPTVVTQFLNVTAHTSSTIADGNQISPPFDASLTASSNAEERVIAHIGMKDVIEQGKGRDKNEGKAEGCCVCDPISFQLFLASF